MALPDDVEEAIRLFCDEAEAAYAENDRETWKEKREEARSLLDDSGFTRIGSGDYRVVYQFPGGDCVLKIAKTRPLGLSENQSEVETWNRAPDPVRDHLAEIHEYDANGRWLVQEHLDGGDVSQEEAADVDALLREHGLHIDEIDVWNMRKRHDGTPVVFDYAGS